MFEIDQVREIDQSLFLVVDKLEVNQVSQPVSVQLPDGSRGFRIVTVNKYIPSHEANLTQDYNRIRQLAELKKQNDYLNTWAKGRIGRSSRPA